MQKYFAIFRLSFVHALKNYKALVGLSIFLITCLIIFAHLWKIAAAKKGIVTFSPDQLLWYIAFNEWVLIAVPDVHDAMELDLRSGSLAYRLPRPISYLGSIFMESLGTLTVNLLSLGTVTVLFTWLQVGMLPFEGVGLLVTLIFGFAAGIIGILFRMIIGVTAFWLQTVDPFFLDLGEAFIYARRVDASANSLSSMDTEGGSHDSFPCDFRRKKRSCA
jgi:ABC-2 type transport system permease protein